MNVDDLHIAKPKDQCCMFAVCLPCRPQTLLKMLHFKCQELRVRWPTQKLFGNIQLSKFLSHMHYKRRSVLNTLN